MLIRGCRLRRSILDWQSARCFTCMSCGSPVTRFPAAGAGSCCRRHPVLLRPAGFPATTVGEGSLERSSPCGLDRSLRNLSGIGVHARVPRAGGARLARLPALAGRAPQQSRGVPSLLVAQCAGGLRRAAAAWLVFEVVSYTTGFNYFQRFRCTSSSPCWCFTSAGGLAQTPSTDIRSPKRVTGSPRRPPLDGTGTRLGRQWLTQLSEAGWWRDPELNLERLARHLGTNTTYLSRALNEGLGMSFNENSEPAARRRDLPPIKFERGRRPAGDGVRRGFNSKTSFNRLFKLQTGQTPSRFRAAHTATGAES